MSPTVETLERLLAALGEDLALASAAAATHIDHAHLAALRRRTPAERLDLALSWNRLAGDVAAAGSAARRAASG